MTMPVLDGVKPVTLPFAEQASQINGFVFLKEKKKHILLDSVETN